MAVGNILDFQTALHESARPDQFQIQINFPSGIGETNSATEATLLLFQGTIPQFTIQDIEVYYRGKQYHEAGEKQFQPWTGQLYNDTEFRVRKVLERWSSEIRKHYHTGGAGTPGSYKSSVIIRQLDRSGNVKRTYALKNAYPTEIGEIQLDYSQGNQIETYNVTFVYDWFDATSGGGDLTGTGSDGEHSSSTQNLK